MRSVAVVALVLVATRVPASVLGGGLVDTDCTIGFEGVTATSGASGVVCTDGDPACDADTLSDGACTFTFQVCRRLADAACTPRDISSITVSGLALDAPAAASGLRCGAINTVVVAAGGAVGATMLARDGSELKDVDYLNLCCRAVTTTLDPLRCALAISPEIAGCVESVPAGYLTALSKARALVDHALTDPASARSAVRAAARVLRRMRAIARKLARSNPCGDALGLVTSHAQQMLRAVPAPR